jgi:hypothetical protein
MKKMHDCPSQKSNTTSPMVALLFATRISHTAIFSVDFLTHTEENEKQSSNRRIFVFVVVVVDDSHVPCVCAYCCFVRSIV